MTALLLQELMKEIESFEMELRHTRDLGAEVVAVDHKSEGLIESQLNAVDESYETLQADAHTTRV